MFASLAQLPVRWVGSHNDIFYFVFIPPDDKSVCVFFCFCFWSIVALGVLSLTALLAVSQTPKVFVTFFSSESKRPVST